MKTRQKLMNLQTGALLVALLLLNPVASFGQQDFFYTFDGRKIHLDIALDRFVVKPAEPVSNEQVVGLLLPQFPVSRATEVTGIKSTGFFEVHLEHGRADASAMIEEISELRSEPIWEWVVPVYIMDAKPVIAYDVFTVKLKEDAQFDDLERLNEIYDVEFIRRSATLPNRITLRHSDPSEYSITEIARLYYENLELRWATPDFKHKMRRDGSVSDPYFTYQFYMHMIQAEQAWDVTTGSSNIIVAVTDDGVMAHEDLPSSRLVNGYDAFGITNGAPGGNEAHGMATAGIITEQ